MAGNEGGIVIQDRDRHFLEELAMLRVVDREQAKIVGPFGSTTRANARLLALTRAGLLRRFFLGTTGPGTKALYALSAKGAKLIGVPLRGPRRRQNETLAADFFIEHQLTINEMYCKVKYGVHPQGVTFLRFESFFEPIVPRLQLIPDGYAELETSSGITAAFIEVDLGHEHGPVWKAKVARYLELAVSTAPEAKRFHRPFRVLVILPSERRLESIRKVVALTTEKIFWLAHLESIRQIGLFAPVWMRPTGEGPLPLIKELL
jgi:hypothetical protein